MLLLEVGINVLILASFSQSKKEPIVEKLIYRNPQKASVMGTIKR